MLARQHQRLSKRGVYRFFLRRQKPLRVMLLPSDPWPGNAAAGNEILQGYITVDHKRCAVSNGNWPGDTHVPLSMHHFTWLRDLHCVGGDQARRAARRIVTHWIATHPVLASPGWDVVSTALRLVNWLQHYSFFGASAENETRHALEKSLALHDALLRRQVMALPSGYQRLLVVKGLLFAAACLQGRQVYFTRTIAMLSKELDAQIADDGSHMASSPYVQFLVLQHLVDIRALCHSFNYKQPVFLTDTIERMASIIRFLRLGDGTLPTFHGTPFVSREQIDYTIGLADANGVKPAKLQAMGLQKVQRANTVLFMDTVKPGIGTTLYHASPLAFEMSVGREKVITSVGIASGLSAAWLEAVRGTAAHSTISIDELNAADITSEAMGRRLTGIDVQRNGTVIQGCVQAVHDGYQHVFGSTMERRLQLSDDGEQLVGEDVVHGGGGHQAIIRFHLHPRIKAVFDESRRKVYLDLPSKDIWSFHALSGTLTLAESICFCQDDGIAKPTLQIVVSGNTNDGDTVFKWVLHKA